MKRDTRHARYPAATRTPLPPSCERARAHPSARSRAATAAGKATLDRGRYDSAGDPGLEGQTWGAGERRRHCFSSVKGKQVCE